MQVERLVNKVLEPSWYPSLSISFLGALLYERLPELMLYLHHKDYTRCSEPGITHCFDNLGQAMQVNTRLLTYT